MNPWLSAFIGLICGIPIGAALILALSLANISSIQSRSEERRQAEAESRE